MCPAMKTCVDCCKPSVGFVVQHDEEKMCLCTVCFMLRCYSIIEKREYPPGATMDEFRQQILEVRI